MRKGYCKLHGEQEELVKAHVIPRSFFPCDGHPRDPSAKTYEGLQQVRRRRTPIGWYDKELCCRKAEDLFSPCDDYAAKKLKPRPKRADLFRDESGLIAKSGGAPLGYWLKEINYTKLKLFFMSVLWRCAASSRPEFKGVSIKSIEPDLRQMILNEDPGSAEQFSVLIFRFVEDKPKTEILFHPFVDKIDGVSFVHFTFGGYMSRIKVEHKPTPPDVRDFQLAPDCDVVVLYEKFEGSQVHKIAMEMISSFATP